MGAIYIIKGFVLMVKFESQKQNFLSPELKILKREIMHDLMDALFVPLNKNMSINKINDQEYTDIIMSCLIMFTRDILSHVIKSSFAIQYPDAFIDAVQATIKEEIMSKFKND